MIPSPAQPAWQAVVATRPAIRQIARHVTAPGFAPRSLCLPVCTMPRLRLVLTLVCAFLGAGCSAAPADDPSASGSTGGGGAQPATGSGPTTPLPDGTMMLQRVNIMDPGIIAPTTALTALVPHGWTTRGGIVASGSVCDEAYAVDWSATSPDGLSMIAILPTATWQTTNNELPSLCRDGSFSTARAYLDAWLTKAFPEASGIAYRDRPDFAQSAAEIVERSQRVGQRTGLPYLGTADGGELTFSYQRDGKAMRGVVGVSAVIYTGRLISPRTGAPMNLLSGVTLGSFLATAPDGRLNVDLIEAARRSITPNREWMAKAFAVPTQLAESLLRGTRERAAIIVAGGTAVTEASLAPSSTGGGASAGASSDPAASRASGSLAAPDTSLSVARGVDTYLDPVSNTPVQLDRTYGNAWRVTNQESYILSKDPNFDPGKYGLEATRMKVVK